ncbi:MAG: fumarylacetoacetate hydrolase family protein [Firmicutes bacterium]|nr:fumarylacetoacetate hydrolase family protein [Bacillota bacterium]
MRIGWGRLEKVGDVDQLWVVEGERATPVKAYSPELEPVCHDLSAFLASRGLDVLRARVGQERSGVSHRTEDIHWRAPISPQAKILCSAVNYVQHGAEAQIPPPSQPFLFVKLTSAVTGPYDPIPKPSVSERMDYEAEWAVMIGAPVKNVAPEEALQYVAGYLVLNDLSFRDLQFDADHPDLRKSFGQNWLHGKGLDQACPAGPYLVTRDEVGDGPFRIRCWVNGTLVQDDTTDHMIYSAAQLVAYASRGITLQPGDVISTGTPARLEAFGRRYLAAGDELVTEVEGLGRLVNRIVDPLGSSASVTG